AALSGDGRITLSWASGDEYDLVGYIIYRNTDSTFTPESNDSIAAVMFPAVAYIDSGLTTGLAYYYRLSSFDEGGNISPVSEQVFGVPLDLTAPLPPAGVVVVNGEREITLTWDANGEGDLEKYQIYRGADSLVVPDSAHLLASVLAPAVTYTDMGLANGFIYYYRLTASDTTGNESTAGEMVSGSPTDLTPPTAITDLEIVNFASNFIELTWTATGGDSTVGQAHSYDLRFSNQEITADNFDLADTVFVDVPDPAVSGTQEELTITGLSPETLYYFAVKTADSTGNVSDISNVVYQQTAETPTLLTTSLWAKFHGNNQNTGLSSINGTETGAMVWSFETGADINSSPVLDDRGDVYFGSEDGNVYALNVDGTLKWSHATGNGVVAAPLVASMDRLYVGSKSGKFYCFNRTTGDVIWLYTVNNEIHSSAAIDGIGRLFFGDNNGNLTCLDSEFGSLYWQTHVGSNANQRIYSAPALSPDGGTVYVGGFDK
ncbi:MAG: PQQ-binding-like beta-propeller repeat protein, partial [Pseudomonadales bacterium]|nr:PQQ-binding-like beta-propeller repeat protein [Pseudomonadales bacterium]